MRTVLVCAIALLVVACASSDGDNPRYTTKLEPAGGDTWSLRVDSVSTMTEDGVRRALLKEAARTTIDRGGIYLRVHEITYEGSVVNVEEDTGPDAVPPQTPTSSEPAVRSEVSFSRQRTGVIRFTTFREKPEGVQVFEASELLDRVNRGETPM